MTALKKQAKLKGPKLPVLADKGVLNKAWKKLREFDFKKIYNDKSRDPEMVAWFSSLNERGEWKDYYERACHADLGRIYGCKALFTAMPRDFNNESREDKELFPVYVRWLVKQSPWKNCFAPISPRLAVTHGFIVTDMNLPANLVANFCMATRQPFEHPYITRRWYEFVQHGVNPNLAFVFATALQNHDYWGTYEVGHNPLDTSSITIEGVKYFCFGKYQRPNQPFGESGKYWPSSLGWLPKEEGDYPEDTHSYKEFLLKTYKPKGAPSNRMFIVQDEKPKLKFTHEEWIEIALAETRRIFNVKPKRRAVTKHAVRPAA